MKTMSEFVARIYQDLGPWGIGAAVLCGAWVVFVFCAPRGADHE